MTETIRISVAYVEGADHFWRELEVPAGTTAAEAVAHSGLERRFPHVDAGSLKFGVFSKPVKPDRALEDGDRVELYRPIIADPETVPTREGETDGGQRTDTEATS